MATTDTPPTVVQHGIYYGFSLAMLDLEKAKYVAAVQTRTSIMETAGGGNMDFVSINGKQITYGTPKGIHSLAEWRNALQNAYAQLAGDSALYIDRAALRFQ